MADSKGAKGGASPVVDVYVKLQSGRTITMDMLPSDTVAEIYKKVALEEGVADDRVILKYTGKVLKRTAGIGYLGICAETILKAEVIQARNYNLYVKLEGGKTVTVQLENLGPVGTIKDVILAKEGVEPNRQILKLGDRVLTDMKQRLVDAGINDEAILHMTLKAAPKDTKKKSAGSKGLKLRKGSIGSRGSGEGSGSEEEEEETESRSPTNASNPALNEADKQTVMSSFNATGRSVEVVFSFDTTGSMYSCLNKVRSKLKETIKRLLQHIPNIRIGIIAHGDYCDYSTYVLCMMDLTNNVDKLVKFVNDVPATGGGDAPECYEWVLLKACSMDWSEESAKALVVIGDATPHPVSYTDQKVNWHEQLDVLTGMEVKVYGVKALSSSESLPFYQELAERTGGAFITFQNFDIISEMFMAVCYREASEEQFEAYCQEVAQSENPTDSASSAKVKDIQKVLSQLEEQKNKPAAENRPERYVALAWWDTALDHSTDAQYTYNSTTDKWSKNTKHVPKVPHVLNPARSASFHDTRPKSAKSKPKRRFSFRSRSHRPERSEASLSDAPSAATEDSSSSTKKDTGRKCIIM